MMVLLTFLLILKENKMELLDMKSNSTTISSAFPAFLSSLMKLDDNTLWLDWIVGPLEICLCQ